MASGRYWLPCVNVPFWTRPLSNSLTHTSHHLQADDGVEEGMEGDSGSEQEEGADAADEDAAAGGSDSDGGGGGGRQREQQAGFMEGGKAASFAKAFSKILDTSGKKAAGAAEAAAAAGLAAAAGIAAAPILAASKSIAKRKAEEAAEEKHSKEAKRLRQEMKQRGHVVSGVQRGRWRLVGCGLCWGVRASMMWLHDGWQCQHALCCSC